MRRKTKNSSNGEANKILSALVDKKKAVLAACLVAVMAFMWIRLLRKDAPQSAQANPTMQQTSASSQGQPATPSKISFVELPKVPGRHDVIARDFFAPGDWWKSIKGIEGQNRTGAEEVRVVSAKGDREVINLLGARLNLEAIVKDKNLQAFINGKLLSVGDKLLIREGVRTLDCEVVQIEQNQVTIRCGQSQVTLKLSQVVEN
ncbi:MAG: hypothetical protein MUO33_12740 [Sedimentisphaerales bacterium]|jgi:preprotein translocase subunit YajC|nr:hypothetical protein [Sedimentisphaerales bacterium]